MVADIDAAAVALSILRRCHVAVLDHGFAAHGKFSIFLVVGHIDAAARGAPAVRDAFAIADSRIVGHGKCSESIHAAA